MNLPSLQSGGIFIAFFEYRAQSWSFWQSEFTVLYAKNLTIAYICNTLLPLLSIIAFYR